LNRSLLALSGGPVLLAMVLTVGQAQSRPDSVPVTRPLLTGAGLGVAGFFAGGYTGVLLSRGCDSHEYCSLEAAFYGAAAGGTLGLALGVHLGNRRRGSFALDFLTGAAVWGAGIGLAAVSDWDDTVVWTAFVLVPIAQLASTVAVERAVGRSRSRGRTAAFTVVPTGPRGALLLGSISF